MTDSPHSRDSVEYWKEKYFDTLREAEHYEQAHGQMQDLLRLAVNRLAVLAADLDPAIDPHLAACREAVRKGIDAEALQDAVSRLANTVIRQAAPPSASAGRILSQLLRGVRFVDGDDDINRFVARAEAVQNEQQLLPLVDELAQTLTAWLKPSPATANNDSRLCALLVAEVLNQLLERLAPAADMSDRLQRLRLHLDEGIETGVWSGMMLEVSDMAAAIRTRINNERRDTERFLAQVTDRLQELNGHFRDTTKDQAEAARDGEALNNALQQHMRNMQTSMHEAEDLAQLKQAVNENLENLQKHMAHYRRAEHHRREQAERKVEALTARLAEMEKETRELHARVRHHRAQALLDSLTGIPNRMAFDERMAVEFARWQRYAHPLSLVVWDVDHFKRINDEYGHQSGDNVLKTLAKLMSKNIRETDFLARYGGEEFVLILSDSDLKGAIEAAEKLRSAVAEARFRYHGRPISVTISCGVTLFRQGDTPQSAFKRADEALYQAKQQGRNRCVAAD